MQKHADLVYLRNKLPIISACALDHIKGFIIIEAEKQQDIYEVLLLLLIYNSFFCICCADMGLYGFSLFLFFCYLHQFRVIIFVGHACMACMHFVWLIVYR